MKNITFCITLWALALVLLAGNTFAAESKPINVGEECHSKLSNKRASDLHLKLNNDRLRALKEIEQENGSRKIQQFLRELSGNETYAETRVIAKLFHEVEFILGTSGNMEQATDLLRKLFLKTEMAYFIVKNNELRANALESSRVEGTLPEGQFQRLMKNIEAERNLNLRTFGKLFELYKPLRELLENEMTGEDKLRANNAKTIMSGAGAEKTLRQHAKDLGIYFVERPPLESMQALSLDVVAQVAALEKSDFEEAKRFFFSFGQFMGNRTRGLIDLFVPFTQLRVRLMEFFELETDYKLVEEHFTEIAEIIYRDKNGDGSIDIEQRTPADKKNFIHYIFNENANKNETAKAADGFLRAFVRLAFYSEQWQKLKDQCLKHFESAARKGIEPDAKYLMYQQKIEETEAYLLRKGDLLAMGTTPLRARLLGAVRASIKLSGTVYLANVAADLSRSTGWTMLSAEAQEKIMYLISLINGIFL